MKMRWMRSPVMRTQGRGVSPSGVIRSGLLLTACFLCFTPSSNAANVCDSTAGTRCVEINANNVAQIGEGKSTRSTYIASSSALVTTATYSLSLEAEASRGYRLARFCVGLTNATAAAGVTIAVNRRSTASSGGTAATAEGTGADSVSKLDPNDSNWTGVVRRTGTLGTVGPTLFQVGMQVGEVGAGAADPQGQAPFCYDFGQHGGKLPIVPAGVANGLSITVTAPGAGGLAFGSISAEIIAD